MKINFSDLLYAFSYGLDCVENQLVRVTTNHGKRVAWFCILLAKAMEIKKEELTDLAGYAVLHDNALTEYIKDEYEAGQDPGSELEGKKLGEHCIIGERNMKNLPFAHRVPGAILYHHEEADGSGPFGKKAKETPVFAQMIHMADTLDVVFQMGAMTPEKYERLCSYVKEHENIRYSAACVEAFFQGVTLEQLEEMNGKNVGELLRKEGDGGFHEYSNEEIHDICNFFARIIDYKSQFTRNHSLGIASKAEIIGRYYGWDEDKCTLMYLAGSVHDLGKLAVESNILEKPDKLTEKEFKQIQNHAYLSHWILSQVRGFEEITKWASHHHEKLDGTGYPFGRTAKELGFEERLMACLDIFQALTEPRPYKDGFSHEKTMKIMADMVKRGFIDGEITADLDKVFGH